MMPGGETYSFSQIHYRIASVKDKIWARGIQVQVDLLDRPISKILIGATIGQKATPTSTGPHHGLITSD